MKIPTIYWVRSIAAAALILLILSLPLSGDSKIIQELGDSGHALLFGCLSLLFLRDRMSGAKPYLIAGFAALVIGAGSELVQRIVGRDAEVLDVVRDGLGAASFLGFAWTLNHREGRAKRFSLRLVAIITMLAAFCPPILTGAGLAHRWYVFPAIADFDSRIESRLWSAGKAELDIVPAPWDSRRHAAKVAFEPEPYSGVAISGPWPDWAGKETLSFVVFSEQPQAVTLNLRIHDAKHNNDYYDRFNAELTIKPGLNRVTIPISEVRNAPRGRQMDLRNIRALCLFVAEETRTLDLYFGGFRLQSRSTGREGFVAAYPWNCLISREFCNPP